MAGLMNLLKMYGSLTATALDPDGKRKTIHYLWDYANEEATTEEEMPHGSERRKASERARWNATGNTGPSGPAV